MEGHIFITGPIGEFKDEGKTVKGLSLTDVFVQGQQFAQASRYYVHFNSPGGNTDEAELIQNYLTRLQERAEVVAVGEGLVASAASKIFLSINKRAAKDGFQLMLHNPFGGVQGDAGYIEMYADEMRKLEKTYEAYYSERLNVDKETISELMDKETFLSLEQCKSLNIINHELLETPVIVAIAQNKEEIMNKEDKNWFEQAFADIKAAFKPEKDEPQAILIMSKEGVELNFPGEAPEVGAKVDAPDGTYNIDYADKAWIVVVTAGVVETLEEVTEEEAPSGDEEMEALKAENAELKKQVESMTAKANEDIKGLKKTVEEMTAYIKERKAIQSKHEPTDENKDKFAKPDDKIKSPILASMEERKKAARERKLKFNKR